MKNKRKNKIINTSFQLRTAITAAMICLVSFAAVLGLILIFTSGASSGPIITTVGELNRAVEDEDNIVRSFKEYAKRINDPIFMLATEKIEGDHEKSMGVIRENIKILRAYAERTGQFLVITIIIMILNAVLMFVYLIGTTHRAAGPVHVMTGQVRALLEGRKAEVRVLRKKDEFREFYDDFARLVEKHQRKKPSQKGDRGKAG